MNLHLLTLLLPVIVLQLILMVVALIDLFKQENMDQNKKIIWLLVILLINLIGPIIYFIFGRRDR